MAQHRSKEIPYQDFSKIREAIYRKRESQIYMKSTDLFVDPSFPPDWSSLTYVYSGDDKYEKTLFKRPIDIVKNPNLVGVGGVCDIPFPWKSWKQKSWFHGAIMVISLSFRFMEKVIPGYRNFEQGFEHKYIGAFKFNIWRFGEWIEVIIDDYLPLLNDNFLFCSSMGTPPEFWGALIEKAYAKCKKTFQAIEYGNILDAITDLTGGVGEFYTPDVNPPENLYHIVYKSNLNRSMMVCWRNNKRLTESAFDYDDYQKDTYKDLSDKVRYLHIITAVTKFPMNDKRSCEMLRIKCCFPREPKWKGKYSELDSKSWNSVNSEFKEKFRPLSRKEEDEFWMTMDDFRCNYGGLFIISSEEPYSPEGLKLERQYHQENSMATKQTDTSTQKDSKCTTTVGFARGFNQNKYIKRETANILRPGPSAASCFGFHSVNTPLGCIDADTVQLQSIAVREARQPDSLKKRTQNRCLKNKILTKSLRRDVSDEKQYNVEEKWSVDAPVHEKIISSNLKFKSDVISSDSKSQSHENKSINNRDIPKPIETETVFYQISSNSPASIKRFNGEQRKYGHSRDPGRDSLSNTQGHTCLNGEGRPFSCVSTITNVSEQSTYSASEISLLFQNCHVSEDIQRPRSAPTQNSSRNNSDTSLASLTQSHFLATKTDFFRQPGRWRIIFEHKDKWTRERQGTSRADMDRHSQSPRILFSISKGNDATDPNLTPKMQGKRHVIISVLQDYRHGPSTANSLLFPIGFCLYRAKNIDRDDRRHLSKLHLVSQVDGPAEMREVNARFDLEPGGFVLVPYCLTECHEGEFLVRILAGWEPPGSTAECCLS